MDFEDGLLWRKASRSGDQGGACVCVAAADAGHTGVRDSKDPVGPPRWYNGAAWNDFIATVGAGDFDLSWSRY